MNSVVCHGDETSLSGEIVSEIMKTTSEMMKTAGHNPVDYDELYLGTNTMDVDSARQPGQKDVNGSNTDSAVHGKKAAGNPQTFCDAFSQFLLCSNRSKSICQSKKEKPLNKEAPAVFSSKHGSCQTNFLGASVALSNKTNKLLDKTESVVEGVFFENCVSNTIHDCSEVDGSDYAETRNSERATANFILRKTDDHSCVEKDNLLCEDALQVKNCMDDEASDSLHKLKDDDDVKLIDTKLSTSSIDLLLSTSNGSISCGSDQANEKLGGEPERDRSRLESHDSGISDTELMSAQHLMTDSSQGSCGASCETVNYEDVAMETLALSPCHDDLHDSSLASSVVIQNPHPIGHSDSSFLNSEEVRDSCKNDLENSFTSAASRQKFLESCCRPLRIVLRRLTAEAVDAFNNVQSSSAPASSADSSVQSKTPKKKDVAPTLKLRQPKSPKSEVKKRKVKQPSCSKDDLAESITLDLLTWLPELSDSGSNCRRNSNTWKRKNDGLFSEESLDDSTPYIPNFMTHSDFVLSNSSLSEKWKQVCELEKEWMQDFGCYSDNPSFKQPGFGSASHQQKGLASSLTNSGQVKSSGLGTGFKGIKVTGESALQGKLSKALAEQKRKAKATRKATTDRQKGQSRVRKPEATRNDLLGFAGNIQNNDSIAASDSQSQDAMLDRRKSLSRQCESGSVSDDVECSRSIVGFVQTKGASASEACPEDALNTRECDRPKSGSSVSLEKNAGSPVVFTFSCIPGKGESGSKSDSFKSDTTTLPHTQRARTLQGKVLSLAEQQTTPTHASATDRKLLQPERSADLSLSCNSVSRLTGTELPATVIGSSSGIRISIAKVATYPGNVRKLVSSIPVVVTGLGKSVSCVRSTSTNVVTSRVVSLQPSTIRAVSVSASVSIPPSSTIRLPPVSSTPRSVLRDAVSSSTPSSVISSCQVAIVRPSKTCVRSTLVSALRPSVSEVRPSAGTSILRFSISKTNASCNNAVSKHAVVSTCSASSDVRVSNTAPAEVKRENVASDADLVIKRADECLDRDMGTDDSSSQSGAAETRPCTSKRRSSEEFNCNSTPPKILRAELDLPNQNSKEAKQNGTVFVKPQLDQSFSNDKIDQKKLLMPTQTSGPDGAPAVGAVSDRIVELSEQDCNEEMSSWLAASMGLYTCMCGAAFSDGWSCHQHQSKCSAAPLS